MAQENKRSFEVIGEEGTNVYYIGMPSADQVRRADWHYSKIYNKALVDGVATSSEMLDILKQRGLYSAEYEQQAEELKTKIATALVKLETSKNDVEKYNLAVEIKNLRDELYQWNQRLSGPMRNTCEQIADDAKMEFLTSIVVQDKDGKQVWKTYDDFLNDPNYALNAKARIEVYLWVQGLDRNFLDNTPEQKVINEFLTKKVQVEQEKLLPSETVVAEPVVEEKKTKKVRVKKE